MMVGHLILDISNIICPEGEHFARSKGAVFLVMDVEHYNLEFKTEYCYICWGEDMIEYFITDYVPLYLAIRRPDGGYWLTRAEKYIEKKEIEKRPIHRALDLRKLPGELGGIRLRKADGFHVTPGTRGFNRWRTGFFCSDDSKPQVWRLEEQRPKE